MAVLRVGFIFVTFSFFVKLGLRKLNGFDVLAVLVLAAASTKNLTGEMGYLIEVTLFSVTVAVVAMAGGANRRGILFISTILLFSDVMVQYQHFVSGELDDLDACTPVKVGAAVQALLFLVTIYALAAGEDNGRKANEEEERESEMRIWLAGILAVSATRSFFAVRECGSDNNKMTNLLNAIRVGVLAAACVVNGEDEITNDNV